MIKLKKPIPYCVITQQFGGNPYLVIGKDKNGKLVTYKTFGLNGHNGLDFKLPREHKDIYAAHSGDITYVRADKSLGNMIEITDYVQGIKTVYGHGDLNYVKLGQRVVAGERIMRGDNTGYSTGPHLHFGLKRIDADGNTLDKDNGFLGAIDPAPYFGSDFTIMRVDDLYGQIRTWSTFLKEKTWAFNPSVIKTLKRLPTNREIKMAVYGGWDIQPIINEVFRGNTNWLTKLEYQSGKQPFI